MRTLLLIRAKLYQRVADHVGLALLALGPLGTFRPSIGKQCYPEAEAQERGRIHGVHDYQSYASPHKNPTDLGVQCP
jgi:hypothetical protein